MSFHLYLFAIFISLWGSTHDSADCWSAHRSSAACDSFKRVHDWCKAGWRQPGAHPQTKILANPVNLPLHKFRRLCYTGAGNITGQRTAVAKHIHDLESRAVSPHFEGHALLTASGMLKQCDVDITRMHHTRKVFSPEDKVGLYFGKNSRRFVSWTHSTTCRLYESCWENYCWNTPTTWVELCNTSRVCHECQQVAPMTVDTLKGIRGRLAIIPILDKGDQQSGSYLRGWTGAISKKKSALAV